MENQEKSSHIVPSTVVDFIKEVGGLISAKDLDHILRATPQGVFVAQEGVQKLSETYQRWVVQKTQTSEISLQKSMKRLFGESEPELFYLVEAKRCFVGYLIKHPLEQPQLLNLPFYLGSVDSAERVLHPRDPLLQLIPNAKVLTGKEGLKFEIVLESGRVEFDSSLIDHYLSLLASSNRLRRKVEDRRPALRDGFRLLVDGLLKAHLIKDAERVLIKKRDIGARLLRLGVMMWSVKKNGEMLSCYELEGKNLFHFVRHEVAELSRVDHGKRRGTLELLHPSDKMLGVYYLDKKEFALHPQALVDFIKAIMPHPGEGQTKETRYTVEDCLHEFTDNLLQTERIEKNKIERHLEGIKLPRDAKFRIHQRWIFIMSGDGTIWGCVDKFF